MDPAVLFWPGLAAVCVGVWLKNEIVRQRAANRDDRIQTAMLVIRDRYRADVSRASVDGTFLETITSILASMKADWWGSQPGRSMTGRTEAEYQAAFDRLLAECRYKASVSKRQREQEAAAAAWDAARFEKRSRAAKMGWETRRREGTTNDPIDHRDDFKPKWAQSQRLRVLRRQGGKCALCGTAIPNTGWDSDDPFCLELDHIVPRSRGGRDHLSNIQATHRRCNQLKGSKIE